MLRNLEFDRCNNVAYNRERHCRLYHYETRYEKERGYDTTLQSSVQKHTIKINE